MILLFLAAFFAGGRFDAFHYIGKYFVYYSCTIDRDVFALVSVEFLYWLCLVVVYFQSVLDGFRGVIGTPGLLATLYHAFYELVFGHFQSDYRVQFRTMFCKQLF